MDSILGGLLDVGGVSAALVVDSTGALLASRGKAVYDRALCEQLCPRLLKVVDAIKLQQEAWDAISAQYADGKLLFLNLGNLAGKGHVLAVVADSTLNPSFATVAIRVATNRLKRVLSGGGGSSSVPPGVATAGSASALPAAVSDSSVLANTGVSWAKGSSAGLSRVQTVDPASLSFLGRCAKELARHVGPMAKVYVEEGVGRVAGDQPFAMEEAAKLLDDLCAQIEDPDDRSQFRKAIQEG